MIGMEYTLEPGLYKDLTEAKADLARHGIVLLRTIETDLEPAIMSAVRDSLASSRGRLSKLDDDALDALVEKLRKTAQGEANDLKDLYTRLLARFGREFVGDLSKDLEGIGELFSWERISRSVEPVNKLLEKHGFELVELSDPSDISESFKMELEEKWAPSFARFGTLVGRAAAEIAEQNRGEGRATGRKAAKKR